MEKGQIVQVKISDMTTEGQGLGKNNGFAIFVKDAVVGDTVDVKLTKVKKKYAMGEVVTFIEKSPDRIQPPCQYAQLCGGCSLQSLNYEAQLKLKETHVFETLSRLGGLDNPKVNPICGDNEPFHYRNKGQFPISTGGLITKKGGQMVPLGDLSIGFYKSKSHDVVDCKECLLQSQAAMAAADALRQFMEEDHIMAYDPKWDKGLMRHLIVKTAQNTGEVMVILVINGKAVPNAEKLVDMLDEAIFNIPVYEGGIEYTLKSVFVSAHKKKHHEIMGDELINIAGAPVIREKIGDLTFEISPESFYQVNPKQMRVLYDKVVEYAALTGRETVLDLYCGVGTIGLYCADKAGQVIGIESVKGAVIDANRNAVINGIVNARYICGPAEEKLPELLQGSSEDSLSDIKVDNVDVVILDPPRSGCDENLLKAVTQAAPTKIIYVSCDPATLARDIKKLTENGYKFEEATPVDMFPWTNHVETVVLMSRVDK